MKKNLSSIALKVGFDKEDFVAFYQQTLKEGTSITKILLIGEPDQPEIHFWKAVYPKAIIHLMVNFKLSELKKEDMLAAGEFIYETSESGNVSNNFELIVDHSSYKEADQKKIFEDVFINNLAIGGLYFLQNLKKTSAIFKMLKNVFQEVPEFSNQISCVCKRNNPKGEEIMNTNIKDGIVKTTTKQAIVNFQIINQTPIPDDNTPNFEESFANQMIKVEGYEHIPVFWTGYQNDKEINPETKLSTLKSFLKGLPRNKKYFTVTQSGILADFGDLDITIFSMSSSVFTGKKVKVVKIPLIGQPHSPIGNIRKDVFASFVGKIDSPLTRQLFDIYFRSRDFHFDDKMIGLPQYTFALARTIFALCPANYGESSFRIWEAMCYGAIPIFITDKNPFLPNFYDSAKPYMIICRVNEIENAIGQLFKDNNRRNELLNNALFYKEQFYSFDGLANYIINFLKNAK